MTGFTKLFSTIVHSTVWREDMHVKVVWVTMLAMADRNGEVQASLPGLADAARVSLEQCEDALARLSAPDKHSRTKEHEGRRVVPVDGGWRLLNYLKYRELRSQDERRIQTREAVRRHRERERAKKAKALTESQSKPPKAHAEAEADAEAENEKQTTALQPAAAFDSKRAADIYRRHYPLGKLPGAMWNNVRDLVLEHGWSVVEPEMDAYLRQTKKTFESWPKFAEAFGTWASGRVVDSGGKPSVGDRAMDAAKRVIDRHRRES